MTNRNIKVRRTLFTRYYNGGDIVAIRAGVVMVGAILRFGGVPGDHAMLVRQPGPMGAGAGGTHGLFGRGGRTCADHMHTFRAAFDRRGAFQRRTGSVAFRQGEEGGGGINGRITAAT